MRPVRLAIQAFGPYPDRVVVDFRAAIEAGLFGIYGQTGSGKSTIFSAMTFALFGEPARAEQEAPALRSDHADPGTVTEVEFVFDIGDRRLVVLRRPDQMRPKQRGEGETRLPHEAFLFDATGLSPEEIVEGRRGRILAEKKVREVDAAIEGMLGYGAEQFRQIVLLPQGRFETFLSAKTRERLAILRDLFDVSLYQSLMQELKTAAEAAERHVRDERELCARRLAAEGFESTDALAAGLEAAAAGHELALAQEDIARTACELAQTALREAEAVEAKFLAAERSRADLASLAAHEAGMNALAARVAQAEQARSLLDVEARAEETRQEAMRAEEALAAAEATAGRAEAADTSAAAALEAELGREPEREALRRELDALERHRAAIERASGVAERLAEAERLEAQADAALTTAKDRLEVLHEARRHSEEAIRASRESERRRRDLHMQIAMVEAALNAAHAYGACEAAVAAAEADCAARSRANAAAAAQADRARSTFEQAEGALSAAQALHLASKLQPGCACPVCGATEHPAPANGSIDHGGLDHAFRIAREVWQRADAEGRAASEALAAAQGALRERNDRLQSLERPAGEASVLSADLERLLSSIAALAPATDPAGTEEELQRLLRDIAAAEEQRDLARDALAAQQRHAAGERARRSEILSGVPEDLQDAAALAAAIRDAGHALALRVKARADAEAAARTGREAALAARKDREAAVQALAGCRERRERALDAFRIRLADCGLSETELQSLKPAIDTLKEDRERIDDFRRRLALSQDLARSTSAAVADLARPDLDLLSGLQRDAAARLTEATARRAGAEARLGQLTQLRDSLSETLRKLDESEAASGPLRLLAGLVNGSNGQRLDLETYAIGAMFDRVLQAANLRLGPMTAQRYRLERDLDAAGRGRRGLGIEVFDLFTGKARPASTLSGGETFIAALALALGLADVVESTSGKVRLDTIFIDEGFGSLDTENGSGTLDQVLQVLNSLVSQNRAVGLISHVPLVQEAIPNGFFIRKGPTGSHLEERRQAWTQPGVSFV
ncbi:AAA family ATPase [Rhodobacter sp. NSM]|uniref:AAA family ATPase n=1 Tax=Rhodobacter sp. NSM TaxID=3457501 RepID=UPI003FD4A341